MISISFADSHCHLQDERFSGGVGQIVERALSCGVETMICCGSSESDWQPVADISSDFSSVFPSFGIHPWYIDTASERWEKRLESFLESCPSGVGEIGLDFAKKEIDRATQEKIFIKQLHIANRLHRPVSIHCRKAWARLIEILKGARPVAGGLVHSFSGSSEMVPILEALGLYISFSGVITRSHNKRGHRAAQKVSQNRLLIETDSPDLMPVGLTGPFNEPANLTCVAECMASLRDVDAGSLGKVTTENIYRLFPEALR